MTYALRFDRTDIPDHVGEPAYSIIPADTTPAEELTCFFGELTRNHVDYCETSPGVYEVDLLAGQRWQVRVVTVGQLDDTQQIEVSA